MAPRAEFTARTVVGQQSQRFDRERVWVVDADEGHGPRLRPERFGETAGRGDHRNAERESGHRAGPPTANAVWIRLNQQGARADVIRQRLRSEPARRMNSCGKLRMISHELLVQTVSVLAEQDDGRGRRALQDVWHGRGQRACRDRAVGAQVADDWPARRR